MEAVFTGLNTAFTTMVSDTLEAFTGILPIVLPILGATIAVAYVLKWVKKISK